MAAQVIERPSWTIGGEPGVLHVAIDQATHLQKLSDAFSDLLHQHLKLCTLRT